MDKGRYNGLEIVLIFGDDCSARKRPNGLCKMHTW